MCWQARTAGTEPLGGSVTDYASCLDKETARWSKVAKETGATLD